MQVLLTGATGFVGSQILERLLARGDTVRVLVRPETLSKPEKVRHLQPRERVEIVPGNLADLDVLIEACEGMEVVYHIAAQMPEAGAHSQDFLRANVQGTRHMLDASAGKKVRRFVFTSSVGVYDLTSWYIAEDTPMAASDAYGMSKVAAEKLIYSYHINYGLEYVILRLSNVYGPKASPYVQRLLRRLLYNPGYVQASANRCVQWVHVCDVVEAVVLAGMKSAVANHTFNIAGKETVTLRELSTIVLRAAGNDSWSNRFSPMGFQVGQNRGMRYDIRKARVLLGYTPKVTLQEGIADIVPELDHRVRTRFLDGKVAIVSGGGRGIGAATARALAQAGAAVVVVARTVEDIQGVAEQIRRRGGEAIAIPTDIAAAEQVSSMVQNTVHTFGRIDILINCAAVVHSVGNLVWEADPESWQQTINVNLSGMFLLSHAVLPYMLRQGTGRLLFVSSRLGERIISGASAYCASRVGANHFGRVLTAELYGTGVTVNIVYPGLTNTPGLHEFRRGLLGKDFVWPEVQGTRTVEPEKMANLLLWLCSPVTAYMTGQFIAWDDPIVQRRLACFMWHHD